MRKDWNKFWQSYRLTTIKNDRDLLFQVGKTVKGRVISEDHFNTLISDISEKLELKNTDTLLDLCCGNGILTYELAKQVFKVIGIDFSSPLIQNAKRFKSSENIIYYEKDIINLDPIYSTLDLDKANKILMYDALAYFDKSDLKTILSYIINHSSGPIQVLLASVLDRRKKWSFFDSPSRIINYLINIKLLNRSRGIGRWWTPAELRRIGSKLGMGVYIMDQNPVLFTSHYRMDIKFIKTQK